MLDDFTVLAALRPRKAPLQGPPGTPRRVRIRRPQEIVDRQALDQAVTAGWRESREGRGRHAILSVLKAARSDGMATIRDRLERGEITGAEAVRSIALLMDHLIGALLDVTTTEIYPPGVRTTGEQVAVVAVGGYGRSELAPMSDIDLLFVRPYKDTAYIEQVVETVLYTLWDMGLTVGHATRSVDDCIRLARDDHTIRTAMLDARLLWGNQALFELTLNRFWAEVVTGSGLAFVEAKLGDRDARHQRLGDSRYVLEPNLKEGKGGQRDLHTLLWIVKYLYGVGGVADLVGQAILSAEAARTFQRAERFLWTVRCHLHFMTGRAEDRLTFDVQPRLAERLGFRDRPGQMGVERFMRRYFLVAKDVGDLTRIVCAVLEDQHRRRPRFRLSMLGRRLPAIPGFRVDRGRIVDGPDTDLAARPIDILRLFHTALHHDLEIHPRLLKMVTENLRGVATVREDPAANRLFLEILTARKHPERTLRLMNESGVFGRFVPDFGRVVAQMQYNMYHHYTTDEHTLRAIGILHQIEAGALADELPVASEVIHKIQSRRALYVAMLLHDIAKGRGGDHSELGARVAERLCPRLGLDPEETETVAWLVQEHLTMSYVAFKRDLDDPKTVSDFVAKVQSPERLRLLLVLTCADIRAVGPNTWNGWKASLLRHLYEIAEDAMAGGLRARDRDSRVQAAQQALAQRLPDWSPVELEAHVRRGYPSYWLTFDADTLERHARLVRLAESEDRALTVETRVDEAHAVTEITIYTGDHPGLFSRIAGALAACGASVVDARITTLTNGRALDVFRVQDAEGGPFRRPDKLSRFSVAVERALSEGRQAIRDDLARRGPKLAPRTRVFEVPPRVIVDNTASRTHTVIEVNGRDRHGLLHDVTRAMSETGLQISSARISTYGERVVDVFYVKDVFGMKVEHAGKLRAVRAALLAAIDPDDGSDQPTAT